jgi:hypothetical protein
MDMILARDSVLNQTLPKFVMVPSREDIWGAIIGVNVKVLVLGLLARDSVLNQTLPKFVMVPSWEDIWGATIGVNVKVLVLGLMFERNFRFLKTDTVDWLSSRIYVSGMMLYRASLWWKRKPSMSECP